MPCAVTPAAFLALPLGHEGLLDAALGDGACYWLGLPGVVRMFEGVLINIRLVIYVAAYVEHGVDIGIHLIDVLLCQVGQIAQMLRHDTGSSRSSICLRRRNVIG